MAFIGPKSFYNFLYSGFLHLIEINILFMKHKQLNKDIFGLKRLLYYDVKRKMIY